jgi:zinc and cadmium transporter
MFLLIRTLDFHHHEPVRGPEGHESHGGHGHPAAPASRLSWAGVALGFALHTTIDGIALAASVRAESGHDDTAAPGLGTFLAVLLHKPLDALAVVSLMAAGGWSARACLLANLLLAFLCPLGAAVFWSGAGGDHDAAVGCALAFSAGVFLCISLADLLPELQFHSHDRLKLSLALLLGVALAYAIGFVEGDLHAH